MGYAAVLPAPADFAAWRAAARNLVTAEVAPAATEWRVDGDPPGLFHLDPPPPQAEAPGFTVPRAFLDQAGVAIQHSDPERFALLYGLLWRLTHGEAQLMQNATDPEVLRLGALAKAVRRDAHKMHAFLRFREVKTETGLHHVGWFEPEHFIEQAEAPFFIRRFAGLLWTIVTPRCTTTWNGEALSFGPGGLRADVPPDDAMEPLWRAYYVAIFNPARLKPQAMRAEMPRKYWRNMPETAEIPRLMAEAPARVAEMTARLASAPNPRPQQPRHLSPPSDVPVAMDGNDLDAVRRDLLASNSLPEFAARATQMVFGEGPLGADLMFVGEQPGDEEDIAGRPFVGPAGRLFDRAMEQAGVPRDRAYVTNAVKHFKYTPTGKRRLHQSPDSGDIAYYRPFLLREINAVAPKRLVALGATALTALTGKKLPVMKTRGTLVQGLAGPEVFATVHPSYLLRLPDRSLQETEFERFVADLKAAAS